MVARGLLAYSVLSALIALLCLAQTLQYSQQLHGTAALLPPSIAANDPTSPAPDASTVPWPTKPFSTFSSVLSSLPFLLSPSTARASPRVLLALFVRFRLHVLSLLNVLCAVLCWLTASLVGRVFSPLSDHERKACRENLFNFLVFRAVFVAAVVPLEAREMACWTAFFTAIAAMRVVIIVARERFTSVTVQPTAGAEVFARLIAVMAGVCVVDVLLAATVWLLLSRSGASWSVLCLLLFEHAVLLLGGVKAGGKYAIHLLGLQREAAWEERNSYLYYCEFVFECCIQLLTIAHYCHVWWLYGLSVTVIDLFLFLHLRSSSLVLLDRLSKYVHYRRASVEINSRYADATRAELDAADDVCTVCRETMDSAKKLPCGHMFHRSCITQWMEYKAICPSCRAPLLHTAVARETAALQGRQQHAAQQQRTAAMYPAQAAARLAADAAPQQPPPPSQSQPHSQPQPASSSSLPHAAADPPVHDDNLEATLALIRQLQAQDAAQLGGLDFGMLNLANGLAGRAAAVPPMGRAEALAAAGAGGAAERSHGAARPIGIIGRSLFRFSSSSIASWLPSFTFELVRGAGMDELHPPRILASAEPTQPPPQPPARAHSAALDVPASAPAAALQPPASHASTAFLPPHSAALEAADDSKERELDATSSPASRTSSTPVERKSAHATPPLSPLLPSSSPSALSRSSSLSDSTAQRTAPSTDRSRRELLFEAFQRRQSGTHSGSTPSTPTHSATPQRAASPSRAPSAELASAASQSESAAVASEEEKLDSSFDDINQHAGGGETDEWSDEDELARTIGQALGSKQRDVEV